MLFNPFSGAATRKWLKDKIFGAEPEFSYQGNGPTASSALELLEQRRQQLALLV